MLQVFYSKDHVFPKAILGNELLFSPRNYEKVAQFKYGTDKEQIFSNLNHPFADDLNIRSMSVGDIIVNPFRRVYYVCLMTGWKERPLSTAFEEFFNG